MVLKPGTAGQFAETANYASRNNHDPEEFVDLTHHKVEYFVADLLHLKFFFAFRVTKCHLIS